jgi:hypothetical protein
MTNIDADQMVVPMKRTALFLGYMAGPKVDDWVKKWTEWSVRELQTGRPSTDEFYWTEIARAFQQAFQDTGARERAAEKLQNLKMAYGEIDSFIAQFETLADEAEFPINARNTISLFASKLPYAMMRHIFMNVKPTDFYGWAQAARDFHQDNTAVQNISSIGNPGGGPKPFKKKSGFNAQQWAKLLDYKGPLPDPNAMDTRADRSRSQNKSKVRTGKTQDTQDAQRKQGKCFYCNKTGHFAKECFKKQKDAQTAKTKGAKGKRAKTQEGSSDEGNDELSDEEEPTHKEETFTEGMARLRRTMTEADKKEALQILIKEDQDF